MVKQKVKAKAKTSKVLALHETPIDVFRYTPNGKQLERMVRGDPTLMHKIAGYSLDTIRKSGIQLNSWDKVEIDIASVPVSAVCSKMDVNFITAGAVTHTLYDVVVQIDEMKCLSSGSILINPRNKTP